MLILNISSELTCREVGVALTVVPFIACKVALTVSNKEGILAPSESLCPRYQCGKRDRVSW